MNKYNFVMNGVLYERISKAKAKRLYLAGKYVMGCPCNLRPDAPWKPFVVLGDVVTGFDEAVARATYYNCRNTETGKYLAFYAKKGSAI